MGIISADLPDYYSQGYAPVRVGLCQVLTTEWAAEENLERTLIALDEAAGQGADLAVTPECVVHGYPIPETREKPSSFRERLFAVAETTDDRNMRLIRGKARDKKMYILAGFIEKGTAGRIHNSAALISPLGEVVYVYRKVHCRHFESSDHWGFFTPGDDFFVEKLHFRNSAVSVGAMICFDREIPESLRCLRALGSEIVLCPLATDTSDMTVYRAATDNESVTQTGAACNEMFVVVVNHAGRFNGGSFITGPLGELFCQMGTGPGVLTVDIPAGAISGKFHNEPLGWMGWGYRRPGIYGKYLDPRS
jgi:5-aminopentanamidase